MDSMLCAKCGGKLQYRGDPPQLRFVQIGDKRYHITCYNRALLAAKH